MMSVARDATKQLEQLKNTRTSIDQALIDAHKKTRDVRFEGIGSKRREREREKESQGETKKSKKDKKKHKKQSKLLSIDDLRAERVRREAAEHERAKQLLQPAVAAPRLPGGRARSPTRYNSGFRNK